MKLAELINLPVTFTVDGTEYTARPLNFVKWGQYDEWLRTEAFRSVATIQMEGASPDERQRLLDRASDIAQHVSLDYAIGLMRLREGSSEIVKQAAELSLKIGQSPRGLAKLIQLAVESPAIDHEQAMNIYMHQEFDGQTMLNRFTARFTEEDKKKDEAMAAPSGADSQRSSANSQRTTDGRMTRSDN